MDKIKETEFILTTLAMFKCVVGIETGEYKIRVWFYGDGRTSPCATAGITFPDMSIFLSSHPTENGLNYFEIEPSDYSLKLNMEVMAEFRKLNEYAYLTGINTRRLFGMEGYDAAMGYITSLRLVVLKQIVERGLIDYLDEQIAQKIHRRIEQLEAFREAKPDTAHPLVN